MIALQKTLELISIYIIKMSPCITHTRGIHSAVH